MAAVLLKVSKLSGLLESEVIARLALSIRHSKVTIEEGANETWINAPLPKPLME